MPPVRVAVIGCGGIAAFAHVPGLAGLNEKPVEILYLCDLDTTRAQLIADTFRISSAKITEEPSAIYADDRVDGVIIADWPATHFQHAMQAISAGKHVLVQKPAVIESTSGSALLAAAHRTRKNVMALPAMEFVHGVSTLKRLISDGALGTISFARTRVNIPGPEDYHRDVRRFFHEDITLPGAIFSSAYAKESGCAADMGPYALALLHTLFGEVELIGCYKSSPSFERACVMVFDISQSDRLQIGRSDGQRRNRTYCVVELGWGQYPPNELCIVMGSNATAILSISGKFELMPPSNHPVEVLSVYSSDIATTVVPPAPTLGQTRWIDAIYDGLEQQFLPSVSAAAWIGTILENVRRS